MADHPFEVSIEGEQYTGIYRIWESRGEPFITIECQLGKKTAKLSRAGAVDWWIRQLVSELIAEKSPFPNRSGSNR